MIYLDNAATSYPKPPQVYRAWSHATSAYGANPGRSGHLFSQQTAHAVYESRSKCAELFGCEPENTIFTLNCTHALNFAIKGLARHGCHFVISDMEHNAVIRPVHAAAQHFGGSYSVFAVSDDDTQTLRSAESCIKPNTTALVCTAASNVNGKRLPVSGLAHLCKKHGICFIVDAAQGAGILPLNISDGINFICAAGHKGLYGPMGTGLLLTDGKYPLAPLVEGGTGSASESIEQPDFLPDRLESGTMNTAGAIALGHGVEFVKQKTPARILRHELDVCMHFCELIRGHQGIQLINDITPANSALYAPVVSFNIAGVPSIQAAEVLSKHGFYLRGGLHCAPMAHKKLGTIEGGTIRFAPSVFTSKTEAARLAALLRSGISFSI